IHCISRRQEVRENNQQVFEDKLGTFKSAKARITLKEGSQPQFRKALEWSDWATPIVPVPKQDGSLIELEEESKKYLTINTSMGLFQYNQLVFGITSAPAIWQRTMDQILEGTSGISCILDDMIVTGKSDAEHMANLEEVLRRLYHHRLRANKSKCEFFKEKITFCGHDINSEDLHKTTNKTAAMVNVPRPQRIGAVLSHVMADGTERPIAFASRSLSKVERNYAQIDKEALATVWGVKKFHNYLFGRNFTLLTDHEPLTSIFHPSKSLPAVTAARLQRYALFLAGFDYTIRYKNTKLHGKADGLSRLPLHSETPEEEPDPVGLFYATQFEPLPVTAEQVKRETQRDPLLVKVHELVMKGWSTPQDEAIKPFYQRKDELTVHCGVLMLGHRAIIPAKLRNQVLTELHEGHLGIVKMKSLARSYIWWPKIDKDIEHLAKSCPGCQDIQFLQSKTNSHNRFLKLLRLFTNARQALQMLFEEKPANKNFDEIIESKLKFSKAVDIAVAMETATRDATEIHKVHNTYTVPKQDGSVRISGDFKAGGKKFSKIDLRQAYHQIELEEESKKYLTINTSMGLFQYNRLVFGITSAPAIWQRTMDQILEGTSGVSCILDDMIVTGKSDAEHMANMGQ
ncbi:Hypothetical predicted protein, partial [Paramuricea clavata]